MLENYIDRILYLQILCKLLALIRKAKSNILYILRTGNILWKKNLNLCQYSWDSHQLKTGMFLNLNLFYPGILRIGIQKYVYKHCVLHRWVWSLFTFYGRNVNSAMCSYRHRNILKFNINISGHNPRKYHIANWFC